MGGLGQVGRALVRVLRRVYEVATLDLKMPVVPMARTDVLHIAIPYSAKFIASVNRAIDCYCPRLIIVHSTVPVGTTRKLGKRAVHSPVRGQHNNLAEGLTRFTKYVSGLNRTAVKAAAEHLKKVNIPVEVWGAPEETELGKLLCLTRYLNDVTFYERAERICNRFKVSRDIVPAWTLTYNRGYKDEGLARPMLKFPEGKLGGSCIRKVPQILHEQSGDVWIYNLLREYGLAA